ncbi:MAG: GatB/YqeY domain-containing protein [Parcubacteria group bacterium]|nr:GatB/YqeY domain-containing protein [Parcubacteria group bacterium]
MPLLSEQLDTDFKQALKSRDAETLSVLRLVRSGIKNFEIEKRGAASDEDIIAILQREIKQHKESIEANEKAGRPEEAARLQKEVAFLSAYLPAPLTGQELKDVVKAALAETGAESLADLGKVMGRIMPQVRGRASGDEVGQMVRELLGNG